MRQMGLALRFAGLWRGLENRVASTVLGYQPCAAASGHSPVRSRPSHGPVDPAARAAVRARCVRPPNAEIWCRRRADRASQPPGAPPGRLRSPRASLGSPHLPHQPYLQRAGYHPSACHRPSGRLLQAFAPVRCAVRAKRSTHASNHQPTTTCLPHPSSSPPSSKARRPCDSRTGSRADECPNAPCTLPSMHAEASGRTGD
jgi:hypothetical protein